jgi:hypothetical protein
MRGRAPVDLVPEILDTVAPRPTGRAPPPAATPGNGVPPVLPPWLRAQSLNVTRHAAALRPFRRAEFGTGPTAPTESHIRAANDLINALRRGLLKMTGRMTDAADRAVREPTTPNLHRMTRHKEVAHTWVQGVERIWDFYFELFGQRQAQPYGTWLLSCDRIALDCYQVAYMGLGAARSIPAPPPFSYMRTGFSPATYRRGIPLTRLGKQINPFPLVQLPYHRLVNPWTLGAVLHEVSHNLQSDLGLNRVVPRNIARRLLGHRCGRLVAAVWTRWNRELFADLSGLLLGGPAVVGSLLDIVGRGPETVVSYSPHGVHPTPYLRALLSLELLGRMGFVREAGQYRRMWHRMYPNPRGGTLPPKLLETAPSAMALVVDTVCFQPYAELGDKSLSQVIRFGAKEQTMTEEAARRLAAGNDPGIIPERFLIGAARFALDHRLARPGVLMANFYQELARR